MGTNVSHIITHKDRQEATSLRAWGMMAFSAAILMFFCITVGYQGFRARQAAEAMGREQATRLIQSVVSHVELTFLAVDMTLRRATERHYFNELFGNQLLSDIENNFVNWVKETPQIYGLYLADTNGKIVLEATRTQGKDLFPVGVDVRKEDFFKSMVDGARGEKDVFLYQPPATDKSKSLILLVRVLYRMNGEVGGIVFAAIDPDYFIQFFRSIEPSHWNYLSIVSPRAELVVSGSADEEEDVYMIDQVRRRMNAAKPGIMQLLTEQYNGNEKLLAMRELRTTPLWVNVVLDERDYLRQWRNDRRKDIGFLAMFAIFGAVLSYFAWTMVSQIRRVEESEANALMASQAKSDFLANMSHELRTPLNAIIGFSEMMDAGYFGKLSPKQKERVHDIHLCGNHLLQLINDILEFSKTEAGKMEITETWFDLGRNIQECVRMIEPRARGKGLDIQLDLPESGPDFYGDSRKIRQLLLNLLTNAVKFTDQGHIRVRYHVNSRHEPVITVEDSGIGMSEDDIPVALSVFGQVHRTTHPEGTGLGLPLCRMFTEIHGGDLAIQSQPGIGTAVSVSFPAFRIEKPEKEVAAK
ncbi:hypothetical protein GC177_10550 [bacterium]|nr:hypothetical protein [bacterium]